MNRVKRNTHGKGGQTHVYADRRPSLVDKLLLGGMVLFLTVLPFHLVIKSLVPGPLGVYWKEGWLGLLGVLWGLRCIQQRRLLLTATPLDMAALMYIGLLLLRFVLDRSGLIGAWGLYISVLYAPALWVTTTTLRQVGQASRERWSLALFALLVGVGALVALGGVAEFILDRALWPSMELTQRQGFPDMYIYGTHIRRVYFTFDSPATLANTLGLLLPLALVLLLTARRWWGRVAAAAAALLMAACILVTFSRGIWVAATLSLAAATLFLRPWTKMRAAPSPEERHPRRGSLLIVGSVTVLLGAGWLVLTMVLAERAVPEQRALVVELAPSAYDAAPVIGATGSLLTIAPLHGQSVSQTWTMGDPLTGREDTRAALYMHPPESGKVELIYRVVVPQNGVLRFAIALSPEVWSPEYGDGVSFEVYVAEATAPEAGEFVFVRYINPKHNPNDRRWRNFVVDLSPWAGRTVNLSLITTAGPHDDWRYDWAGWAGLYISQIAPGYFDTAQTEHVILQHTSSILDWTTDDTNRDRLAAWRMSWEAWSAAPLWGHGLGVTGAAALRTQPERALVTESQILKGLVELGLPGLLVWLYLWFQIARVGYHAYSTAEASTRRWLLWGILTSLLTIFVEGWVYQNLEAKQVNAYFWTLVGALTFLAAPSPAVSAVTPASAEDVALGRDDV